MEELKNLLIERETTKAKLMIFKRFVDITDIKSDSVAFEKRVKANKGLYNIFNRIQSRIEIIILGTSLEAENLEERESFEAMYFGVISVAEKRINDFRTAQVSVNDPIPGTSGSHTTSSLSAIQQPTFNSDIRKWLRLMQRERSIVQEINEENICEAAKLIQEVEDLEEQEVTTSVASSTISVGEHSHATNSSEHSCATNSSKHLHAINSSEHSRATNSSEHSYATNSSEHSRATNSSEHSRATNSSEHSRATNSSEHSRATNSSEHSYATNSNEHSRATNSSEHSRATNSSEHSRATKSSEHSRATNSSEHSRVTNSSEHSRATNSSEHSRATNSSIYSYGVVSHVISRKCSLCRGEHVLHKCPLLLAMTFTERHEAVKRLRVCFNCFYSGHSVKDCTRGNCKKCGKKHHTVLHRENKARVESIQSQLSQIAQACFWNSVNNEYVVLSTAIVYVIDDVGNKHPCRALLDAGSQAHLVTEEFCDRLKLALVPVDITLNGVGNNTNSVQFKTQIRMFSGYNEFIANLSCLVLKNITTKIPNVPLTMVNVPMPSDITPADPHFQYPDTIDLLIGAGLFWKLLRIGQHVVKPGDLVWQNTRLGWVLGGCFYLLNNKQEAL